MSNDIDLLQACRPSDRVREPLEASDLSLTCVSAFNDYPDDACDYAIFFTRFANRIKLAQRLHEAMEAPWVPGAFADPFTAVFVNETDVSNDPLRRCLVLGRCLVPGFLAVYLGGNGWSDCDQNTALFNGLAYYCRTRASLYLVDGGSGDNCLSFDSFLDSPKETLYKALEQLGRIGAYDLSVKAYEEWHGDLGSCFSPDLR